MDILLNIELDFASENTGITCDCEGEYEIR